ncbi:MAG: PHP domain-containing protein, partial [Cytophagaceae bacterium]
MYLNCHSYHSLRYGTIPLQELVNQAAACGVTAMALTDINTVTGIYEFTKACHEAGIKPLVGIEFRRENEFCYIGIARNREGLGEMCRMLTAANFDEAALPGNIPVTDNIFGIYTLDNAPEILGQHEYIGIRADQLPRLYNTALRQKINKMVVLQPVTVRTPTEYSLHKILRAIDLNIIGSRLSPFDHCSKNELMTPESELIEKFADYPVIVSNTRSIIEGCDFEYDFDTPKNKKYYT